jgi:hypothetical protein
MTAILHASPMNVSDRLAPLMIALVPYLVQVKAPSDRVVRRAQLAAGVLTGGQVRQWLRTSAMDNPEGRWLDLAALVADPLVQRIPHAIADLLFGGMR